MGDDFLEIMKKAQEEGEKRRLAQLAARTPEQIARDEENRRIEIETHRKRTGVDSQPAKEMPVPAGISLVTISGQNTIGEIITYRGEAWLVTHCWNEAGSGNEDEEEEYGPAPLGWNTSLVRVSPEVMEVVSEQYQIGAAQFTGATTVKFADEEYASSLLDLAYSPEIGLYDRTRVHP